MIGEIGDERRLDRPVQALADPEDRRGEGDQGEGREAGEPEAADGNEQPGGGPDDAHHRQHAHTPAALGESRDRELREHDHERVDSEERADPALADSGLVLA